MDAQAIRQKIYEIRGQRVMLDFDLARMYGVETRRLNEAVKRNIERFPEDFMFQLTQAEFEIWKSQFVTSNPSASQLVMLKDTESMDDENLMSQFATSSLSENQQDINWISQFATSNFLKKGLRKRPFAFTENGVSMLSSVLRSPLAIQVNIGIMRAFTEFRHIAATLSPHADIAQLRKDFEELKLDIQDILADQNDINEDTRMRLGLIEQSLAEMQAREPLPRPMRRIGFVQDNKEDKKKKQ